MSVGDEAGREAEEGFVDVVASFPADPQPPEAVQPGDRPFYDPTEYAQAGAVFHASFGDDRADAAGPEQAPVLVVVVTAVGEKRVGSASGPADGARHGGDLVQQGQQLRDVVAVSAGQ